MLIFNLLKIKTLGSAENSFSALHILFTSPFSLSVIHLPEFSFALKHLRKINREKTISKTVHTLRRKIANGVNKAENKFSALHKTLSAPQGIST